MTKKRFCVRHCRSIALCLFLLCPLAGAARAGMPNLAFGDKENQISAYAGLSLRGDFEKLGIAGLQYSQPNKFFRLPGRMSMELMTARGAGSLSRYNQPLIFGFVQDVVFPVVSPVYAGINLGIYIKSQTTDRISSQFMFGEKVFLGVGFLDDMRLELYWRHFSNGTLTEKNAGQNFTGLSVMRNF